MDLFSTRTRFRNRLTADLVRGDRLVLYVKQQLERSASDIENKDTKTVGEGAYRLKRLMQETMELAAMGGEEQLAEIVYRGLNEVGERSLRVDTIKQIQQLRKTLDEYVPQNSSLEVEELRAKIAILEQQRSVDGTQTATSGDLQDSKTIFVIMPFALEFTDVWKGGIERAAKDNGMRAIRVDMINRSTNITDDIIESIKNCHIAIVDVTNGNPNVMFELGYVVAENKPHIIISQSAEFLPFDIRHIRTIVYQNSWSGIEQLKSKVSDFLKETSKAIQSHKSQAGKIKK